MDFVVKMMHFDFKMTKFVSEMTSFVVKMMKSQRSAAPFSTPARAHTRSGSQSHTRTGYTGTPWRTSSTPWISATTTSSSTRSTPTRAPSPTSRTCTWARSPAPGVSFQWKIPDLPLRIPDFPLNNGWFYNKNDWFIGIVFHPELRVCYVNWSVFYWISLIFYWRILIFYRKTWILYQIASSVARLSLAQSTIKASPSTRPSRSIHRTLWATDTRTISARLATGAISIENPDWFADQESWFPLEKWLIL